MEYEPKDTTITINNTQIIQITKEVLVFFSYSNTQQSINLAQCNKHWTEHVVRGQNDGSDVVLHSKCIAVRDISAAPPWIEFFSEPRLRVLFPPKYPLLSGIVPKQFQSASQAFRKTAQLVIIMGWTTYDLS